MSPNVNTGPQGKELREIAGRTGSFASVFRMMSGSFRSRVTAALESAATLGEGDSFALITFGVCFGLYHWFYYTGVLDRAAPVGTVMLSVLPIILGVQLFLQAVALDVQSAPTEPLQKQTRMPKGLAPPRTVDIPRAERTTSESKEREPEPKA